jgi:TP901 family phage tail tape measure protein
MVALKDHFVLKFGADLSEFNKALKKIKSDTKKTFDTVSSVTNTAAIAFVGLAGAIGLTTAAFAEYEKGLIAVQKTSNLSDEETQALGDDLIELSKKAPLAVDSLLEIAESAGQLGIKGRENILLFTDTVAKLEATTNLKGAEAAKTLARILNLTGENVEDVDKLGSSFVRLGNNVAASESEIAEITKEIAKSTAIFRIGAANAVGLGASLAELGINAERGGTVVGRAFEEIKNAIDSGGDSLTRMSLATGIAASDLKTAFETDATAVFTAFLASVGNVVESGGNATKFLEEFGLKGAGVSKVLSPLSLRIDALRKNLNASSEEFSNATASEKEFAKASEAISAKLKISQNKLEDAQRTLGEKFAPVVLSVTTNLANFVDKLNQLDSSTIQTITQIIAATTAIIGVTAGIGLAIKAVLSLKLAFIALSSATGPIGLTITALSAATSAVIAFFAVAPTEAKKSGKETLKAQEKANEILEKEREESSKRHLEQIQELYAKRARLVEEHEKQNQNLDEEGAERALRIQKLKLEKQSLIEQGAQKETIELKEKELSAVEKLDKLKKENAEIAAKENKTAIDVINQEANIEEISQLETHLNDIREKQEESDDDVEAEIGDFEDRTRKLIQKSHSKKLDDQKEQLEKIDALIADEKQKGSFPDQEDKLQKSLDTKEEKTKKYYEKEEEKQKTHIEDIMGFLKDEDQDGSYPDQEDELESALSTQGGLTEEYYKAELGKREQFLKDYKALGEVTAEKDDDDDDDDDDDTKKSESISVGTQSFPGFDASTIIERPRGVTVQTSNNATTQHIISQPGRVIIGIDDNAIGFITARQVENEAMGLP